MSTRGIALSAKPATRGVVGFPQDLFPAPRAYSVELWDGSDLPATEAAKFRLVLQHPAALRRMITPPLELSLGEAYIYGDMDIRGDLFSADQLIDQLAGRTFTAGEALRLLRQALALPTGGPPRAVGRGPARLYGRRHSRVRDRAAIQFHYDVGNDFYSLWLDRNLQYSCAYFAADSDDLDTAQVRKMDHICRKLRLQPGERLLDIGCGWGRLALHAAQHYGVQVLGVTLSQQQWAHAESWVERLGLRHRVRFELKDYRDLQEVPFDKVVSIGMFEHVGRDHLPEYFAKAHRLLGPGGLFLNHGISRRAALDRIPLGPQGSRPPAWRRWTEAWLLGPGSFSQRYVFPDSELVPVSEANLAAEKAGFEVRDVENLREHYALTLRRWVGRLEARGEDARRASDEITFRTWRLFLAAAALGFERGQISVNQTLLSKPDRGQARLPLTRAHLYSGD